MYTCVVSPGLEQRGQVCGREPCRRALMRAVLVQMPHSLHFEPMKLCSAGVTCLPAGSTLPETNISVLNGSTGKVVKALMAGRRHHLEVVSSAVCWHACYTAKKCFQPCVNALQLLLASLLLTLSVATLLAANQGSCHQGSGGAVNVQVQTLYYLGPAGTGTRKRSAAAAAQQGNSQPAGTDAAPVEAAADVAVEAVGKKGGKRNKRRKMAATADKENSAPEETGAGGVQKAGSLPPPAAEVSVLYLQLSLLQARICTCALWGHRQPGWSAAGHRTALVDANSRFLRSRLILFAASRVCP